MNQFIIDKDGKVKPKSGLTKKEKLTKKKGYYKGPYKHKSDTKPEYYKGPYKYKEGFVKPTPYLLKKKKKSKKD